MLFFLRQMDRIRHHREANMATGTHTDLHHRWTSGVFNGTGVFVVP